MANENRQFSEEVAQNRRLIGGLTGAAGAIFGVGLLGVLRGGGTSDIETHTVISGWGGALSSMRLDTRLSRRVIWLPFATSQIT